MASSTRDEARLAFIQGVIEDAISEGPRPALRHQLERALRAVRIEVVAAREANDAKAREAQ